MKPVLPALKRARSLSFYVNFLLLIAVSFLAKTADAQKQAEQSFIPGKAANGDNDSAVIYLNAGNLITNSKEMQATVSGTVNFTGRQMHLVQFRGAIQPARYNMLTAFGAEVIDYIPNIVLRSPIRMRRAALPATAM